MTSMSEKYNKIRYFWQKFLDKKVLHFGFLHAAESQT